LVLVLAANLVRSLDLGILFEVGENSLELGVKIVNIGVKL
jgi:hypothetical protein